MNLHEALNAIANQLNLNADSLIAYAAEDEIGGWPVSLPPHVDWPGGSVWSVEGKTLYAITRAMQPEHIFESGTKFGCSTTHFLKALQANKKGVMTSVDLGVDSDISGDGYGSMIPKTLKDNWTLNYPIRTEEFLDGDTTAFDIAYEDTDHTVPTTVAILSRLKARPSIHTIISHDVCHPWVGYDMREAWTQVFGEQGKDWQTYCIEPSDCGLGIWRRA